MPRVSASVLLGVYEKLTELLFVGSEVRFCAIKESFENYVKLKKKIEENKLKI